MENGSFEDAFPIQHEGYSIAILVYQRVSENKNYKPNIAMENRSFEDAFPIKHGGYAILVNQKGKWKHENPQNSLHSTCCNISSRSQVPHVSSWWLNQPIWKICSSNWIMKPQVRINIKNIWVATTQCFTRFFVTTTRVKSFFSRLRVRNWPTPEGPLFSIFIVFSLVSLGLKETESEFIEDLKSNVQIMYCPICAAKCW